MGCAHIWRGPLVNVIGRAAGFIAKEQVIAALQRRLPMRARGVRCIQPHIVWPLALYERVPTFVLAYVQQMPVIQTSLESLQIYFERLSPCFNCVYRSTSLKRRKLKAYVLHTKFSFTQERQMLVFTLCNSLRSPQDSLLLIFNSNLGVLKTKE